VVATASNDAAANVTAEIPGIDAVRGCENDALAIDYFSELGSLVLGEQTCGLVTAVLGNMKYRSAFAGRFWFGDGTSRETDEPGLSGMMDILREASSDPTSVPAWAKQSPRSGTPPRMYADSPVSGSRQPTPSPNYQQATRTSNRLRTSWPRRRCASNSAWRWSRRSRNSTRPRQISRMPRRNCGCTGNTNRDSGCHSRRGSAPAGSGTDRASRSRTGEPRRNIDSTNSRS
jgi:hypothetical protein